MSEIALLGIAGMHPDLTSAEERGIESSDNFPPDSGNLLCDSAQAAEHSNHPSPTAYLVSEAAQIASNVDQLTEGACGTLTQPPEPLTAFYPDDAATLNFPFTTVNWGKSTATNKFPEQVRNRPLSLAPHRQG